MNKLIFTLLIILVFGGSAFAQDSLAFPPVAFNPVNAGETFEYKVTFGFFTVGKAQIQTSEKLYRVNGRPCYKIDVRGKTSGALTWVAAVDDTWGAYVDTLAFLPYLSYRHIKENNYRKNELTKFDQRNKMVELKVMNQKTGSFREPNIFQAMEPVRDVVTGYTYLRTLDYENKMAGDTITLYGVFEDEFYHMDVLFAGREILNTKLGKMDAYKLVPVMPTNQLFSGENAITIWLSADANKIPLKVEANMVIGKAGCEIISVSQLKSRLNVL